MQIIKEDLQDNLNDSLDQINNKIKSLKAMSNK